ncbi:hypothetical protein ALC53_03243 [Atta colombica]|uniref:Uncharacterized protein n=1 Tax=Atta colombica TaxID=520822 RepID=A0A195BQ51_9HYME|nr:hypothetical protein ALC53_03243 [Atta colombica]
MTTTAWWESRSAENWSGQRFPTKSEARRLEARKLLDHMC